MIHDSLQAYLEAKLKVATNITPELITSLKAEWRKDYVSRYNKQYRDGNVQITFRVTKAQYRTLVSTAKQGELKPTVYCRQLVISAINGKTPTNMQSTRLLLMQLIDAIEEAQYENTPLKLDDVLTLLQQMQNSLL